MIKEILKLSSEGKIYTSSSCPSVKEVFNLSTMKMERINSDLTYGVAVFDPLSKRFYYGFFNDDPTTVMVYNGKRWVTGFSRDAMIESGLVEVDPDVFVAKSNMVMQNRNTGKLEFATYYPGSVDTMVPMYKRKYKWIYNRFPNNYGARHLLETFQKYHKLLYKKKYQGVFDIPEITFGIEFETSSGAVPQSEICRLGMVPLRDGSITGTEYATIPYKGKNGIGVVNEICDTLQAYTDIDKNCSLHVHVGIDSITKEWVIAAYNLFSTIEDEVLSMFPINQTKSNVFKKADKCYCKKLNRLYSMSDSIEDKFNKIYTFYYGGETSFRSFTIPHPADESGDRKWDIHQRYIWINFINVLFGKQNTLEFRIHTPTLNKYKVIPWVYICIGITKFINSNVSELSSAKDSRQLREMVYLNSIIRSVYKDVQLQEYLISYIEYRKKLMIEQFDIYGDSCGYLDIVNDRHFKFTNKGVKLVEKV